MKQEASLPEGSWFDSAFSTQDESVPPDLKTPEAILRFPMVGTMEEINRLLDREIEGQGNLARASSVYEPSAIGGGAISHRRSRSLSPFRTSTTPFPSPTLSPQSRHSEEFAEHLRTKPLPDTPETPHRRKVPSKQMIGDHGWLHRDTELARTKSQQGRQTGFRSFASRWKLRADDVVRGATLIRG